MSNTTSIVRGNSLYTTVDGPTWTEAEAKSVQLGGHLATVGDARENKFLVESFPNQPAWYMYWIGLNDAESEGVYSWSSGEAVTYYNWRPTSGPNRSSADTNSIGPSYIEFQVNDLNESRAGQWNDTKNDAVHEDGGPGIAEIPFIRRGDSAYVIVEGPSWEEAEANANALGGHLVTINDAEENEWLHQTFNINQTLNAHQLDDELPLYWAGYKQIGSNTNWEWVSGEQSSYENWGPNQPNHTAEIS